MVSCYNIFIAYFNKSLSDTENTIVNPSVDIRIKPVQMETTSDGMLSVNSPVANFALSTFKQPCRAYKGLIRNQLPRHRPR